MKKRSSLTSIDVGTTKICTTIAEINENGDAYVVGVGLTPSNGLHKGLVVNINEAREAIRSSVRKAEQSCNYKVESAYVGVTGRHVNSVNNKGVVAITRNDRLVRRGRGPGRYLWRRRDRLHRPRCSRDRFKLSQCLRRYWSGLHPGGRYQLRLLHFLG